MSVWTIILAAGAGSRFGGPKALAAWKQGTLLSNAISLAPMRDKVIVVTGAHAESVGNAIDGAVQVHNADWQYGMGSSISAGLAYVSQHEADVALIVPVDQPFITQNHLQALAVQAAVEKRCILTQDAMVSGPPAAIPSKIFSELLNLKDVGLKSVLENFGLCDGSNMLHDIDTQEDLIRFTAKNQMV